jgi:hypothetical protein
MIGEPPKTTFTQAEKRAEIDRLSRQTGSNPLGCIVAYGEKCLRRIGNAKSAIHRRSITWPYHAHTADLKRHAGLKSPSGNCRSAAKLGGYFGKRTYFNAYAWAAR